MEITKWSRWVIYKYLYSRKTTYVIENEPVLMMNPYSFNYKGIIKSNRANALLLGVF